jgi:NADH-quinone oxidoreductase subunit G
MATVIINGEELQIDNHERLNVIQAAERVGVEIPHYCYHHALSVVGSCRMCLVEIGTKKNDQVVMQPRLVPGCQTPAGDGTVIVTNSVKVKEAQAATLEYLLLNHPLDCPTCDQAGECFLQDYTFKFGNAQSRMIEPKVIRQDKPHIGEQITLFTDRCVMCSRCVRFTREISGTAELEVINRGAHSEIDIYPGQPCNNKLAGNVVDLCPVGALCSKDFLYKQRVWWLKTRDSVCTGCSTGCSIYVDENNEHVYRLRPRENHLAQGDFMCDDGRFGYKYIHAAERLTRPAIKGIAASTNGDANVSGSGLLPPDWGTILDHVRDTFTNAAHQDGHAVAAVFSPWMTCEDAYLLADWLKRLSPHVLLSLGPVPIVGEDDLYPKNWRGVPVEPTTFTIRAEKCPNRIGVSEVLQHFQKPEVAFDTLLTDANSQKLKALYVVGGGPPGWFTADQGRTLAKPPFVVAQDILPNELTAAAHVVLPGASFAEKDGTYVNHAGLAQMIHRAIRCPAEGYTDGRILMELAGRTGLFNAKLLRQELSRKIPYFAPLAVGDLGGTGVRLQPVGTPLEHAAR